MLGGSARRWVGLLTCFLVIGAALVAVASEVRVGVDRDIKDFTPFNRQQPNYPIMRNIYDYLMEYQLDGTLEPMLVETWEVDGTVITLHLREGVVFHDLAPFTAQSVLDNFAFAADPATGFHLYEAASYIQDATAIDTYTVQLTVGTGRSVAWMLEQLGAFPIASPTMFPLMEEAVGTGPFMFEEWVPGVELVLVKNPNYWAEGLPKSDRIVVVPYADPRTMADALLSGQIDWCWILPTEYAAEIADTENMVVTNTVLPWHDNMYLKCVGDTPFTNKQVRQAIQYAMDREAYAEIGYFGFSEPVTNVYWKYLPYYVEAFNALYYYDLDKARQLITEAGYPDGFEFTLIVNAANSGQVRIAPLLAEDLAKIGVTMNIDVRERTSFRDALNSGDYEAIFSGYTPRPLNLFASSSLRSGENNLPWDGPPPAEYVEVVDMVSSAATEEEVTAANIRAQYMILDLSWSIVYCTREQIHAWSSSIEGAGWDSSGYPKFHFVHRID